MVIQKEKQPGSQPIVTRGGGSKLYIIRGIPGSGKSTLAQSMVSRGIVDAYYEADMYFMQGGKYMFDPSKLSTAHEWCQSKVFAGLKAGKSIAVSNTFTTRKEMFPYVNFCRRNGIHFDVVRLETRFQSIHDVPQAAIDRMLSRFEDWNGEAKIVG